MARRRAAPPAPRVMVAAAARGKLIEPRLAERAVRRMDDWQREAWAAYDDVPEVKFAVMWAGDAISKVRLHIALVNPADPLAPLPVRDLDGNVVDGVDPAVLEAAEDELRRLRSPMGGLPEIVRALSMQLEVPGEGYLVGWGERDGADGPVEERWEARSTDEVRVQGKQVEVRDGPSAGWVPLDPERDSIIRVWRRHPRFAQMPDSNVRAVLTDAKALATLSAQVIAEANSRRAAGVLLVPNEMFTVVGDFADPEDAAAPGDTDDVFDALLHAMEDVIENPDHASSVMPVVLRGPAELLDKVRHVQLSRQSDSSLDERIEKRVRRIARGLNVPVEVVEGHMATTFANAEQIDQDAFDDHLQPRCVMLCDFFTTGYLRPNLVDVRGVDPEAAGRLCVWFDPSAVVRQPDTEAAATEGFDKGLLSGRAWRAAKGFTEDDAPSPEERLQNVGLAKAIMTGDLLVAILEASGYPVQLDLPAATSAPPGPEEVAAVVRALAAAGGGSWHRFGTDGDLRRVLDVPASVVAANGRRPVGERMAEVDRTLRLRLLDAANAAVDRAVERAGNRLRNRTAGATRRQIGDVPARDVARVLGVTAAAAEEALEGAWDSLEDKFRRWARSAGGDAVDLLSEAVGGLSGPARAEVLDRLAVSVDEAWAWARAALDDAATNVLLSVPVDAVAVGEVLDDAAAVPPGLVRELVARAGGAAGLLSRSGDGGAWVTLADGGTRPAGGIATGEIVRRELVDGGAMVEAYRWVYGPAARRRPFEPHQRLDGLVFRNFDDDALRVAGSFPSTGFYIPGDHKGCICDAEPLVVPAGDVGTRR